MKDKFLRTDFDALQYVKRTPSVYIANLHQVVSRSQEKTAEAILGKYGTVRYKKEMWPTFTGYVNLKRLSYDVFYDSEKWVGTPDDHYAGAQLHARMSRGDDVCPLRVYVLEASSIQQVVAAKAEIRSLVNVGNHCVHINDTHEEAVWLAETYFNANSWTVINRRPFDADDMRLNEMLHRLVEHVNSRQGDVDDVCVVGDAVLSVLGVRSCGVLEFVCRDGHGLEMRNGGLVSSVEDGELLPYARSKDEILDNPECHFYFQGIKFASLALVRNMKRRRMGPDDGRDARLLEKAMRPQGVVVRRVLRLVGPAMRRIGQFVFQKNRGQDGLRTVRVLKCFRFSYTSRRRSAR